MGLEVCLLYKTLRRPVSFPVLEKYREKGPFSRQIHRDACSASRSSRARISVSSWVWRVRAQPMA